MPPKLLLADDSITVQRVIALTFAGEGLDVITVGDGDLAVERIASDQPEIVLADVSMPGRDGYAVAEFVKRSAEHADRTRVVLLTGAFEPVDEGRTRALGVDGVLAKPFEPQMAIGLVKRLLEQPPSRPSTEGDDAGDGARAWRPPASASEWSGASGERSALARGSDMAAGYPFEPRAAPTEAAAELDDYFRRLDAALESAGLAAPAVATAIATAPGVEAGRREAETEPVGIIDVAAAGRDADSMLMMDPPTSLDAPDEPSTLILPAPPRGAASDDTGRGGASLVDTFAALLAVEQGEPGAIMPALAPLAATSPASSAAPSQDALVDLVTQRVIERISDAAIRDIVSARVVEVAERLVREEIARIKAEATD